MLGGELRERWGVLNVDDLGDLRGGGEVVRRG
jgi:hypothetical protein